MSEKLKSIERSQEKLRFPEDPNQYSEEELMADPAKRFHVNPADFPIFSRQINKGESQKARPIDETMGRFVRCTADCIAVIAGEDMSNEEKIPAADHVIYLDKSARPVCWINNIFWDAFTNKPRPNHSFLAIDRKEWFNRVGIPVDGKAYKKDGDKSMAKFADFLMKKDNVSKEDIARIRSLFIPGGIENEDIETIMNTPTILDGKNITIVDEVSASGSTLEIAKHLLSHAIPKATVNGCTYWDMEGTKSVPVWYDETTNIGRGIGDINENFFAKRYEQYPNPKTRAQKFGAIVLGSYVDLSKEQHNRSRQLAKEMKIMRKEWDDGHIIMASPKHYDAEKWESRLKKQGIEIKSEQPLKLKNSYSKIWTDIQKSEQF